MKANIIIEITSVRYGYSYDEIGKQNTKSGYWAEGRLNGKFYKTSKFSDMAELTNYVKDNFGITIPNKLDWYNYGCPYNIAQLP